MMNVMPLSFKPLIASLILAACTLQALAQTGSAPAPTSAATPAPPTVLASGEQTYKQTCFACHASGAANAPKFGDRKVWAPLIAEGQAVLTAHAWVGVRGMPPRGGRADLSQDEFAAATAFMARAGGAS